ncbi:hypothetical protein VTO42DRAFT_4111 [Malbranchea cinnamomea]
MPSASKSTKSSESLHHRHRRHRRTVTEDDVKTQHGHHARTTESKSSGGASGVTKRHDRKETKSASRRSTSDVGRPKSTSDMSSSKTKSASAQRPSTSRRSDTPKADGRTKPTAETSKTSKKSSGLMYALFGAPNSTTEKKVTCLTCFSDDIPISRSAKLACSHRMCHACLKRIFVMSVSDPQHMPPRCCTSDHIPLKHVEKLFDDKFKKLWNKKYQEYMTSNRIYCPAKGCGEWIKPSHIYLDTSSGATGGRRYGKCSRCKTKVCVICNGKWHRSRDCPKDEHTLRLMETAKEKGWQRCYNCSAMVELKEGCNHMTCRCTAQFCMICGAKWKSCECPWFNYSTDGDLLQQLNIPQARINELRRQAEAEAQRARERIDEEIARRLQLGLSLRDNDDDDKNNNSSNAFNDLLTNQMHPYMIDDFVPLEELQADSLSPQSLLRPRQTRPDSPIQENAVPEDEPVHSADPESVPPLPKSERKSTTTTLAQQHTSIFGPIWDGSASRRRRHRDTGRAEVSSRSTKVR